MVPVPIALGLTICEKVIVEQGSANVSLVSTFTGFRAKEFPYLPQPFCVFASLTGGQGEAEITLTITQLDSDEEIEVLTRQVVFPDRFKEFYVLFRFNAREFHAPGEYMFTLLVDGDWVAHRRIHVRT